MARGIFAKQIAKMASECGFRDFGASQKEHREPSVHQGFRDFYIGYKISAFSVTLFEVTYSPNKNGQVSRPVLTLVYMKNGRYKLCMNQTSEDMPPFNPY